jgi:hypothetical protein
MIFTIKYDGDQPDKETRTFSVGAVYMAIGNIVEYMNTTLCRIMHHGFKTDKPVQDIEIEVTWKVAGKKIDDSSFLEMYPEVMGFSLKALAEIIKEKAEGGR